MTRVQYRDAVITTSLEQRLQVSTVQSEDVADPGFLQRSHHQLAARDRGTHCVHSKATFLSRFSGLRCEIATIVAPRLRSETSIVSAPVESGGGVAGQKHRFCPGGAQPASEKALTQPWAVGDFWQ